MTRTQDASGFGFSSAGFPAAAFAFGKQAEDWCTAQKACFANWQGFAERWSKHRMQDIESTVALAVRPWTSLDPRELAEMQQKWVAGIVDRCTLDIAAFTENVARSSRRGAAPRSEVTAHASPRHRAKHQSKTA